MIIETRVFNIRTRTMVYFDALKPIGGQLVGQAKDKLIELDAKDPVMMKSCMVSADNEILWEGDVCDCALMTEFGLIKDRGVVTWRGDKGGFVLGITKSFAGTQDFKITEVKRIGNVFENPELFQILPEQKDAKKV